jgi:hypothetical protein
VSSVARPAIAEARHRLFWRLLPASPVKRACMRLTLCQSSRDQSRSLTRRTISRNSVETDSGFQGEPSQRAGTACGSSNTKVAASNSTTHDRANRSTTATSSRLTLWCDGSCSTPATSNHSTKLKDLLRNGDRSIIPNTHIHRWVIVLRNPLLWPGLPRTKARSSPILLVQ